MIMAMAVSCAPGFAELLPIRLQETAGPRQTNRVEEGSPLASPRPEVTASAVAELHLADRGPIWAAVKAPDVDVYPL